MDIKKVKRGIEYQDYHGTLATRLDICRIEKRPPSQEQGNAPFRFILDLF